MLWRTATLWGVALLFEVSMSKRTFRISIDVQNDSNQFVNIFHEELSANLRDDLSISDLRGLSYESIKAIMETTTYSHEIVSLIDSGFYTREFGESVSQELKSFILSRHNIPWSKILQINRDLEQFKSQFD
jgi:hypothetical protein